jgi:hypothetical protein
MLHYVRCRKTVIKADISHTKQLSKQITMHAGNLIDTYVIACSMRASIYLHSKPCKVMKLDDEPQQQKQAQSPPKPQPAGHDPREDVEKFSVTPVCLDASRLIFVGRPLPAASSMYLF